MQGILNIASFADAAGSRQMPTVAGAKPGGAVQSKVTRARCVHCRTMSRSELMSEVIPVGRQGCRFVPDQVAPHRHRVWRRAVRDDSRHKSFYTDPVHDGLMQTCTRVYRVPRASRLRPALAVRHSRLQERSPLWALMRPMALTFVSALTKTGRSALTVPRRQAIRAHASLPRVATLHEVPRTRATP